MRRLRVHWRNCNAKICTGFLAGQSRTGIDYYRPSVKKGVSVLVHRDATYTMTAVFLWIRLVLISAVVQVRTQPILRSRGVDRAVQTDKHNTDALRLVLDADNSQML